MKVGKKLLLDEKSTRAMYRDTLKAIPLMNSNSIAQKNIAIHYRQEFEKQRVVSRESQEHRVFREGIVRTLSNLLVFDITRQYKADPERFQNKKNIYESDSGDEEEAEFTDETLAVDDSFDTRSESDKKDSKDGAQTPSDIPFF